MVEFAPPPVVVLMGVSGCGKSTVAGALHGRLGWPLIEGDDLHPAANLAKMAAGHPLDDDDREPWLARVRAAIDEQVRAGHGAVVTCSALKRRYRDVLREPHVVFVHLTGTRGQLLTRLAGRHGHFMPLDLLDSQLADLEPPDVDEQAMTVPIDEPVPAQAATILDTLHL